MDSEIHFLNTCSTDYLTLIYRVIIHSYGATGVPGKYANGGACKNCTKGYYCPGDDNEYIGSAGTWSGLSQSACTTGLDGEYSNAGDFSCSLCTAGTYSTGGDASCSTGAAGTYSADGAASCSLCNGGEYSAAGASSGLTGAAGSYSTAGSSSCTTCPADTYSATAGSSSCTSCGPGTYSLAGATSCLSAVTITNPLMTAASGAIVTETGSMDLTFDTSGMQFASGDVITLALDSEMSVSSATPTGTENLGEFTISSCTYDSGTNTLSITIGTTVASPSSISITVDGVVYPNSSTPSYPVSGGATLQVESSGGFLKGSATDVKIEGVGSGQFTSVTITPDPFLGYPGDTNTTVQFDIDLGHNIMPNTTMEIYWPKLSPGNLDHVTNPTCSAVSGMSASLSCTYDTNTQIMTLTNLVDNNKTGTISFSVSGVDNPNNNGIEKGFTITTYHVDGSIIDEGTATFKLDKAAKLFPTWTQLDTQQVSLPTRMEVNFTCQFQIDADSTIRFTFPDDIPLDASLLTSYTGTGIFQSSGVTFNILNQTTVEVTGVSTNTPAGTVNSIVFDNILNSQKVKATNRLGVAVIDSTGNVTASTISTSGPFLDITDFTPGLTNISGAYSAKSKAGASGVYWYLYFNPESPIIENSTDTAMIRITMPSEMTLDATCLTGNTTGQIDSGLVCTAVNGGTSNVYEITLPFGGNGYTQDLLNDLGLKIGTMTNPSTTGVTADVIIETRVIDDGSSWLVDNGTFTVCVTSTEVYYWDITDLTIAGSNIYPEYNNSIYTRLYINKNNAPAQYGNYNSQGYMGEEDNHSMCTQSSDSSYNTGTISFAMYIYITDLSLKQYLYCKTLFQGNNPRRGFGAGLNGSNTVFTEINVDPNLGGNTVETLTSSLTYTYGWHYFGCYSNGVDSTQCFMALPDGTTSSSGIMSHAQPFVDDDDYYTGLAGYKPNKNNSTNAFYGMINELGMYTGPVTAEDLASRIEYGNCDPPCPACLSNMYPTCLEYLDTAYIGKWDFRSPIYQTTSTDSGSNSLDFILLDDQLSYDPIYVHNQGLYFDGTSHIRTSNVTSRMWKQDNEYSITYEAWIRPQATTLKGDLLEFEISPGELDSGISFNGSNIQVDMQGAQVQIPITYSDVDEWHYVGVSIQKLSATESQVGVVFGTQANESGDNITAVLTNSQFGNSVQVGNGFTGMIRDFSLLDWPKRTYEFTSMVQTSGGTPWNGVSGVMGPAKTGECISSCAKEEFGDSGEACLIPNCRTGYGDTFDQGYSCLPGYDFTYHGQSGPGEGGNGFVEPYLNEMGDDGNLEENDGCSSVCVVEPGWTCTEKTPTSPSVCTRKCEYIYGFYFGVNECQDGNNDPLDGGYDCKIETGWKGVDGSPWNPDVCNELGGDGINYGEHEGDDGNNIDGDGCSATCTIEWPGPPKWLGESGNEKAPDFCHEWGGDGFRHEDPYIWGPRRNLFRLQEVTGDDGNLRSGEGCDGLCRIEEGFVGSGGSTTYPDVCSEEGGDRRHFNYDQCDDGNNTPDDGGDATGHMEGGFQCLNGTPERPDDCDEIGGDNLNHGWYTCDDGNIVDGDGCSSTGVTEAGYGGTGGTNETPDFCTELCGDGINAGLLECDDKNINDGDGCSSECLVEVGWTGSGGSSTTRDYCVEDGGDGLHQFWYECDDGNNDNGDGCDSTGYIEAGWDCLLGDPSYGYKSSRAAITSATISQDSTKITLVFNTTVLFTGSWTLSDWRLEMFGPKESYPFTYSVKDSLIYTVTPTDTIEIDIVYDLQYYGYDMESIVLTFVDRFTTVDSTYSFEMIDTQYTFTLHGREIPGNANIELMGTLLLIVFLIVTAVFLTAGVLGYSIGIWFDFFSLLQLVHMFPCGRFYFPTSLYNFFKTFEILNFIGINFGLWNFDDLIITSELGENGQPANYNFEKMGFTTRSFLLNAIDPLMVMIYLGFLPVVLKSLSLIFSKSVFFKNVEKKLIWTLFPFVIYITGFILIFAAVLNINSYNMSSGSEIAGVMTSLAYFMFLSSFIGYLGVGTVLYWLDLRKLGKKNPDGIQDSEDAPVRKGSIKGVMFFMQFRSTHFQYYCYPLFYIIRRILVAGIYVIFMKDGFSQLVSLSILSACMLAWLASYQPFRSRMRNLCAAIFEFSYLAIGMLIFPYVYPDIEPDVFEKQQEYVVFVFISILLLTLLLACSLIVGRIVKDRKKLPNKIPPPPDGINLGPSPEDLRKQWLYNEDPNEPSSTESGEGEDDPFNEELAGQVAQKPKGALERNDSFDSVESEESESSDSESSSGTIEGNMEDYAFEKLVPSAQVNLDDNFNTGFSSMREAQIQKFREQEKRI